MSVVFLIPAVSIKSNIIPFITIVPSTVSLVVPSISVTIAFSSCNKLFSRLLLPTFGLPIIAVFIPSFIIFPFSLSFIIFFISFSTIFIFSFISLYVTSSISSYSG